MGGGGVTAGGPTPSPICKLHYIYSSLCKLIMKDEVEELNKIILFAKRTSTYGKSLNSNIGVYNKIKNLQTYNNNDLTLK